MIKSRGPFFSILSLGVFVYFWKKFSIPFILIGSLRSLIIFYISHSCYFNLQKFSSILILHLLSDQNRIQGEEFHTLRSKTLEIKNLSSTGILLIRGTMGYHFLLLSLFFFLSGYRGTPNSTAGHLSIFSARLSSTCSFLFPRNILIFA